MKMRGSDGFTLIELLDRRGDHRRDRGHRGAGPPSRDVGQRGVGHRVAPGHQFGRINVLSSCGANGYAVTLADLAKPAAGTAMGFISPDLSINGVVKSGYDVNLAADAGDIDITAASATCNASTNNAVSSYLAEAHPVTIASTGQRSFATDTRGTIYFLNQGTTIAPGMAGESVLQ